MGEALRDDPNNGCGGDLVDLIVLLSKREAYNSFSVFSQIAQIIFLFTANYKLITQIYGFAVADHNE